MNAKLHFNSLRIVFLLAIAVTFSLAGCGGKQIGHILKPGDQNLVGSHAAGAATFDPLVDDSVLKLLGLRNPTKPQRLRKHRCFLR